MNRRGAALPELRCTPRLAPRSPRRPRHQLVAAAGAAPDMSRITIVVIVRSTENRRELNEPIQPNNLFPVNTF